MCVNSYHRHLYGRIRHDAGNSLPCTATPPEHQALNRLACTRARTHTPQQLPAALFRGVSAAPSQQPKTIARCMSWHLLHGLEVVHVHLTVSFTKPPRVTSRDTGSRGSSTPRHSLKSFCSCCRFLDSSYKSVSMSPENHWQSFVGPPCPEELADPERAGCVHAGI